jgi:hypothetical protein
MSVSGSRSFPDTPRATVTDIPVLHGVAAFAESQLAASTTTVRPHLLPAPPTAETRLSTFTLSSCGCLEHHIQPDRPRWESDFLREHFGVSDPKGRFDPGRTIRSRCSQPRSSWLQLFTRTLSLRQHARLRICLRWTVREQILKSGPALFHSIPDPENRRGSPPCYLRVSGPRSSNATPQRHDGPTLTNTCSGGCC